MIVLGIDPGLAALGWAVVDVRRSGLEVLACGVLRTRPWRRGQRESKSAHETGRVQHLAAALDALMLLYSAQAVAVEAKALPFGRIRHSGVSALGRVRGALDALCWTRALPQFEVSAVAAKRAAARSARATKAEVTRGVALVAGAAALLAAVEPRSCVEHSADAIAVVLGCEEQLLSVPEFARAEDASEMDSLYEDNTT